MNPRRHRPIDRVTAIENLLDRRTFEIQKATADARDEVKAYQDLSYLARRAALFMITSLQLLRRAVADEQQRKDALTEEKKTLAADVDSLRNQRIRIADDVLSARAELQQVQAEQQEVRDAFLEAHEEEKRALRQTALQEHEDEKAQLAESVAELRQQHDTDQEKLRSSIRALRREQTGERAVLQKIRDDQVDEQDALQRAQDKTRVHAEQRDATRREADAEAVRLAQLQTSCATAAEQLSGIQAAAADATEQVRVAHAEVESLDRNIATKRALQTDLARELSATQAALEARRQRVADEALGSPISRWHGRGRAIRLEFEKTQRALVQDKTRLVRTVAHLRGRARRILGWVRTMRTQRNEAMSARDANAQALRESQHQLKRQAAAAEEAANQAALKADTERDQAVDEARADGDRRVREANEESARKARQVALERQPADRRLRELEGNAYATRMALQAH